MQKVLEIQKNRHRPQQTETNLNIQCQLVTVKGGYTLAINILEKAFCIFNNYILSN